ncbi:MAG: tyrosine-type recombinase/integrase [Planctomycetes bacterium]|nr:tyrosine-type recombinase/integrase [Planctomycetota bacterium]
MSAARSKSSKPKKPYPTFPLTPHPNGQWCKKIRGKVFFFGVWSDPKSALQEYTTQAADLHAGRRLHRPQSAGLSVRDLSNNYLANQKLKAERGLITASWYGDCLRAVRAFAREIGPDRLATDLSPIEFGDYRLKLYDRLGVCAIDRNVAILRSMFRHAFETDLIAVPVKFGGQFNKPSQKEKRQNRSERDRLYGKRLFSAADVRSLLDAAHQPVRTMILLGMNGGFGNTDCAELPIRAVDLKHHIIEFERPKTAVQRIVPLWPETIDALREVIHGDRPKARRPEYEGRVFLTAFGNPWKQEHVRSEIVGERPEVGRHYAIVLEFKKLLKSLNLNRKGLGFYALRHTFRTWADETRDQHAVHRIMGHAIPGMSGVYVEEISIDRLRAVTGYVHDKLFNPR